MKSKIWALGAIFTTISALPAQYAKEKPEKPLAVQSPLSVAVLDMDASGALDGKGGDAATLLTALLSVEDDIILVERTELAKVLGEAELAISGTVKQETAIKIGQLTGAKVLITGKMFSTGKTNYIVSKVISAETSRVFAQTTKFGDGEDFGGAIESLAEQVGKVLREKKNDLVVKVETPEERTARLKKLVAGKKLPSVYVNIPEHHVSRPIPDPAAQTEIQLTLQKLGFTLARSSEVADVSILGEAFSESAGRRANLISCRARVEIKVSGAGDGLFVDRQTSVAIDLAENIAAKSALQEAGLQVVERIIPKLVK